MSAFDFADEFIFVPNGFMPSAIMPAVIYYKGYVIQPTIFNNYYVYDHNDKPKYDNTTGKRLYPVMLDSIEDAIALCDRLNGKSCYTKS